MKKGQSQFSHPCPHHVPKIRQLEHQAICRPHAKANGILNGWQVIFAVYSIMFILRAGIVLQAQPAPINDDFSHRIVCTGMTFSITGSTVNATVEPGEYRYYACAPQSVWFTWTPTQSALVVVEKLQCKPAWPYYPSYSDYQIQIGIFTNSFLDTNTYLTPIQSFPADMLWKQVPLYVQGGISYQISVQGDVSNFSFKFTAYPTNAIVFNEQPRSRTVVLGDSVVFSASALGLRWSTAYYPPGEPVLRGFWLHRTEFQWFHDGMVLPGEDGGCLLLSNVTIHDVGAYTAVASNSMGAATSAVANLFVTLETNRPWLEIGKNFADRTFQIALAGETGACYQVESSTNLLNWQAEAVFPHMEHPAFMLPETNYSSLAVNCTNGVSWFAQAWQSVGKFFRVSIYRPANVDCVNQLKQIRWAKDQWAAQNNKGFIDYPMDSDLMGTDKYLKTKPKCPAQGMYTYNRMDVWPTCSVSKHVLVEPR